MRKATELRFILRHTYIDFHPSILTHPFSTCSILHVPWPSLVSMVCPLGLQRFFPLPGSWMVACDGCGWRIGVPIVFFLRWKQFGWHMSAPLCGVPPPPLSLCFPTFFSDSLCSYSLLAALDEELLAWETSRWKQWMDGTMDGR
jgi:hypothetical protein